MKEIILAEHIRVAQGASSGPWEQLSGKYMAIDHGESPQAFRTLTPGDEAHILANDPDTVARLCAALLTLARRLEERDEAARDADLVPTGPNSLTLLATLGISVGPESGVHAFTPDFDFSYGRTCTRCGLSAEDNPLHETGDA